MLGEVALLRGCWGGLERLGKWAEEPSFYLRRGELCVPYLGRGPLQLSSG